MKKKIVKKIPEETEAEDKRQSISLEERDAFRRKLFKVDKHIKGVHEAIATLCERIIDTAETEEDLDFAKKLLQRGYSHDLSKFTGIEWESLNAESEKELLHIAMRQHHQMNDHHAEHFIGGIREMNNLQIAEMVADLKARSSEFGSDLRTYIKEELTERLGFTVNSKVYKTIKKFVDLLLDDQFKK